MESTNMTSEWVTTVTIVKEEPVEVPECDVVIEEEPKDYSGALLANRDLKKGDSSPKESDEVNTNSLNEIKVMIEAVPKEDCDAAVEDWPPYPDVKVEVLLDAPPSPQATGTSTQSYVCDICDKAFKQNSSLYHHRRLHSGERPFHCETCFRTFKRKAHLHSHKSIHDPAPKEGTVFPCDVCEKANSCYKQKS
ncbi:hypothetical protein MSG28_015295 [Choristoneura fumiferana]|uniref:Uncharacterized protein n=1 Tax=Choristoneura fumiferana TaxID=7141 RepID=A0ACC0K9P9_CHOFU|nr:hypothetical protein MSG28_015295 [Choristoneura fumiferana]